MLDTDKAWEKWGRNDPYFGVLADERFSAGNIAQWRQEFFGSGRHSVELALGRCESVFGKLNRDRALDHGCGVGRVTLPLAGEFAAVVALDVSTSMLDEARSNAREFKAENIAFALADDTLSNAPGEFDFVNSHMVLQHVPVRRGLPILTRLLDKVGPGGGFHLHVSFRTEPRMLGLLYWSSANVPGVKIIQNILARRPWNAPAMQMNNYRLNRIVQILVERDIQNVMVAAESHGRFVTCSLIGRKLARG